MSVTISENDSYSIVSARDTVKIICNGMERQIVMASSSFLVNR